MDSAPQTLQNIIRFFAFVFSESFRTLPFPHKGQITHPLFISNLPRISLECKCFSVKIIGLLAYALSPTSYSSFPAPRFPTHEGRRGSGKGIPAGHTTGIARRYVSLLCVCHLLPFLSFSLTSTKISPPSQNSWEIFSTYRRASFSMIVFFMASTIAFPITAWLSTSKPSSQ